MKKETLVKIYHELNAKTSILEKLRTINCFYRLRNRLHHEYSNHFQPSKKMKRIEYHIYLYNKLVWFRTFFFLANSKCIRVFLILMILSSVFS